MDFYPINGLTQQLHESNMESPIGFSAEAEDDSIQNPYKRVRLQDGATALSEKIVNSAGTKQLSERQVNLQPDPEKQGSDSKAEAIRMAARDLVDKFQYEAIEKSPNNEVQCAVFLECLKLSVLKTLEKLSKTHSLSGADKLRIMLAAEKELKCPITDVYWEPVRIPVSIRFEKAKRLFQSLPDTPSLSREDNVINLQLTALNPDKMIKDRLLEIRQILKLENNELSRQLLSEVDNIEKEFMPRVGESGHLSVDRDNRDFKLYTTRLLYLYAACSGFSQEADIAELTSYIRSVLYTTHSLGIWHIAKELAYLSKQPGSIDYCRYISAVANLLKTPAPVVSKFEELQQLSDIDGFVLLESKPLDNYLSVLRANIGKMTPEYSQVLRTTVDNLESNLAARSPLEDRQDIKVQVHRLLVIIAACKSSKEIMDTSVLEHFVGVITEHGNTKNIPYLISGLARLVQSTQKIQQILGKPGISGGPHLRMAPLQWLAFVPDRLSEDDIVELCQSLQAPSAGKSRRQLKDGKVFYQWLATLERALTSKVMNKAMLMPVLKKLTQSLTYEKLCWLHMIFKMGDRFNQFLHSMGFSCQKEGLPLLIAEKGGSVLEGENEELSQWLMKQRHYHLLPFYMVSMIEYGFTEITDLIHKFIETNVNNTFIENRQSPLNNPHLQAVYKEYPEFQAGWGANFSDFSEETRNKLLSPEETLKLSEDPWDLFISGLEVHTCLSPNGVHYYSCALMSYLMDGRNAMIIRKSSKGNILGRSIIRMVLDQDDRPALFLEKGYPDKNNLLFIDAARDIADEMGLPLYHCVDAKRGEKAEAGEEVKLLKGRAPYDYFDSINEVKERQAVTFTNVKRDVMLPFSS
ncbi:hypothetical protein [Endozoicomonas sp. ONNA2]|uniref:hypothetical protein n=1 Tax=Endozoicomonas sp. ONNA2 TaxID=2828741 RepID=UPI002147D490|nr:hypothetical protein [Endozoicomonas sp. ONNA2]